jgi:hypothetical protein
VDTASPKIPAHVVSDGDNVGVMSCPMCAQYDRDERLLSEAMDECAETRRYVLSEEEREAVEQEERLLADLLARILERRAA